MKTKIFLGLLLAGFSSYAQNSPEANFKLTRPAFKEQNAFQTTAFVEKYFRLPGNTGFDASIHHVEDILKSRFCSAKTK